MNKTVRTTCQPVCLQHCRPAQPRPAPPFPPHHRPSDSTDAAHGAPGLGLAAVQPGLRQHPAPQSPAEPGGPAHQGTRWASLVCPPEIRLGLPCPIFSCCSLCSGSSWDAGANMKTDAPAGPLLPGLSSVCVSAKLQLAARARLPVSPSPWPPLYSPHYALFGIILGFCLNMSVSCLGGPPSCCFLAA